jgi:hypothetical protein
VILALEMAAPEVTCPLVIVPYSWWRGRHNAERTCPCRPEGCGATPCESVSRLPDGWSEPPTRQTARGRDAGQRAVPVLPKTPHGNRLVRRHPHVGDRPA